MPGKEEHPLVSDGGLCQSTEKCHTPSRRKGPELPAPIHASHVPQKLHPVSALSQSRWHLLSPECPSPVLTQAYLSMPGVGDQDEDGEVRPQGTVGCRESPNTVGEAG